MRFIPLIAIGLALAACGSEPASPAARAATSPPADQQKAVAAYVDCLRQHGIPANNNGTVTITGGGGPSQSDAQAALQTCQSLRPAGTVQAGGGAGNQQSFDQLLRWAACMRQHGANVPDPSRDPSTGGITIQVPPGQDQQTVQAAQQACSSLRPSPGQPG
jgi:hypothetical protein